MPRALRALADGIATGAYRYTRYFTGDRKPKQELKRAAILVTGKSKPEARAAVAAGRAVGESRSTSRAIWSTVRPTT